MNFSERPHWIPAGIVGAPVDFPWQGKQAHIGPVERVTPLLRRLGRCTALAEIAMCAGVLQWATWRLTGPAEVGHYLELAEAAFAYCVDWRYADRDAGPSGKTPDQPPALSAAMKTALFLRDAIDYERNWNSFWIPVGETFHAAHVVKHVLQKRGQKPFESWLETVADRLAHFFPLPDLPQREFDDFEDEAAYDAYCAPRRGVAVPPQLLDPTFDYDPSQREALVTDFVRTLDPKRNRYLRSAEAMRDLGFEGTPYA